MNLKQRVDTSENERLSIGITRTIHLKVSNICNIVCQVLVCYKCSIVNTIINI